MVRVSVIVVSFNTRPELEACLASIAAHPPDAAHEVVVVDNASTDGTPDALGARWPSVRLIEMERNVGFAGANNAGIRVAAGEFVLLLNSDTLVGASAIDRLVSILEGDPTVAAAGPRLVDGAGRVELSFGAMMAPLAEARQKLLVTLHERKVWPIHQHVCRMVSRPSYPDWLSGACLLVRRHDAIAAGLLDERYFLYGEDVDFCAALRALGKRLRYSPEAVVVHLRGRSGRQRPRATERAYRQSQLTFYAKHHPRWLPILRAYLRIRGKLPGPSGA